MLNDTLKSKELVVLPTPDIFERELRGKLNDYEHLNPEQAKKLDSAMKANTATVSLLFVITGVCVLFGGLDIIWSVMDLFQLLSYLKYLNVDFPTNVLEYLESMGKFNIQALT
jgi:hypothetical protein